MRYYYPSIYLAGQRKTTTHFSISDSGPDLKPRLSRYEIGFLRHFGDFVLLIHTILYFSPFSYCYIKYTGVLTTLIHVSPIVQGTIRLKTAISVEVSNVYTEDDLNADWALQYLMSTTDGRRTDLVVSHSAVFSTFSHKQLLLSASVVT
jgi:hypothetical protein